MCAFQNRKSERHQPSTINRLAHKAKSAEVVPWRQIKTDAEGKYRGGK